MSAGSRITWRTSWMPKSKVGLQPIYSAPSRLVSFWPYSHATGGQPPFESQTFLVVPDMPKGMPESQIAKAMLPCWALTDSFRAMLPMWV